MYYIVLIMFGNYIRSRREEKKVLERSYSVRQVAYRIGVEPAYLSKVERNEVRPPSELKICRLADELGENPDVLLAMAGKVRGDLLEIIRGRPTVFPGLLRSLRDLPEPTLREVARKAVEGKL